MVHALADGLFRRPGLAPPELVGRDAACYESIFEHLAARDIRFEVTEEAL
jgi:hypothetical protein